MALPLREVRLSPALIPMLTNELTNYLVFWLILALTLILGLHTLFIPTFALIQTDDVFTACSMSPSMSVKLSAVRLQQFLTRHQRRGTWQ